MPARKKSASQPRKARVAKKKATTRASLQSATRRVARKAGKKKARAPKTPARRSVALKPKSKEKEKTSAPILERMSRSTDLLAPPRRIVRFSSPVPDPDVRTPAQISSHGSFDHRSRLDPDKIAGGEKILNEQFSEEDHYTNRTRNPRIGTRGRKRYE